MVLIQRRSDSWSIDALICSYWTSRYSTLAWEPFLRAALAWPCVTTFQLGLSTCETGACCSMLGWGLLDLVLGVIIAMSPQEIAMSDVS